VTYLARYLRGGPIKNARLVACDGDRVTFTCRARSEAADGGGPSAQRLTLAVTDFLQRWLLHVPVPQTRVVRSYGLYHPTQAAALARCRAILGQPPVEVPAVLPWQTVCAQRGDLHPERCPAWGQLLVCTGGIPRGGLHHRHCLGSTRHEICTAGAAWQGGGVPAGGSGMAAEGWRQHAEALRRSASPAVRLEAGPITPAPGRLPEGARGVTSIAAGRRRPGQAVSVRGPSNQGMKRTSGRR
jgi:hypothetical protein